MTTQATQSLGPRLRSLRQEREWTQTELAQRSGVDQRQISDYEIGRRVPRLENGLALARALGVSLDELVAGGG